MLATGLYVVVCSVSQATTIVLGDKHLVEAVFAPGVYVYTGSGGANVWKRVERHRSRDKPAKWNIDRLTLAPGVTVTAAVVFPNAAHDRECELNQRVGRIVRGDVPVPKFGSHDCTVCPAHLWRCRGSVDSDALARRLRFGKFTVVRSGDELINGASAAAHA